MQNSEIKWQVETQGKIYEADFEELKQWIAEGAVLSSDKVRRGDLRWLTVEKVPELYKYFTSDHFSRSEILSIRSNAESAKTVEPLSALKDLAEEAVWEIGGEKFCYLHKDAEAVYACVICKKMLCKICPNSYGGKVKLCPLCDSLCCSADERFNECKSIGSINKPYYKPDESYNDSVSSNYTGFRLADFIKSVFSVSR